MADEFYTGIVTAPNPHYYCETCKRDLWSKRKRLKNPNSCPSIMKSIDGRILCEKCFYKDLDAKKESKPMNNQTAFFEIDKQDRPMEMFERQADEITTLFVMDSLLSVVINRKFDAVQIKALCSEVQRIPGIRFCHVDKQVNAQSENTCLIVSFRPNRAKDAHILRAATRHCCERFIVNVKPTAQQQSLF